MPFNPQGDFTIINNIVQQYLAGQTKANPTPLDENYSDIASGMTQLFAKAGAAQAAADAAQATADEATTALDGAVASETPEAGSIPKAGEDGRIDPAFIGTMLCNTREVLTESGTYTAPVTGWYKVTCIGGGGGGGSASFLSAANTYFSAGGGSSGETIEIYFFSAKNATIPFVIGAGGIGAKSENASGISGGETSIIVGGFKNNARGGGGGGMGNSPPIRGNGGTPSGNGEPGEGGCIGSGYSSIGGNGGGIGGGKAGKIGQTDSDGSAASYYGGGGGGGSSGTTNGLGGDGGNGAIILEYFDPSKAV